jgi:hypothetical protein
MALGRQRSTVQAEVIAMIGIVGTIVLIPLAIIGLVIGIFRFAVAEIVALVSAGLARLAPHG